MSAASDATDPRAPVRLAAAALRRSLLTLAPDDRLGGYRIIALIGAGGMGEVYRAHDPRLARDVALKVLRPGLVDDAWLVREAQALAQLRHPGVVAVHEVGAADGRGFVAMEYVAGASLRAWLAAAPRPRAAILAVFIEAGRGLAAAHAAGLVHRDFKPDNVLVGDDGRVRVTDFGLALPIDADDAAPAGTPAYMAPEQHAGAAVDARADQFGFCVALHEALAGGRPVAGADRTTVAGGDEPTPTSATSARLATVPPWLRAVISRGLATDPAARFPSMTALLTALGDDPAVRRRQRLVRAGIAALAVAAVAGAIGLARGPQRITPGCRADDPRLAAAWSPTVRARLTAAFVATGRPDAAERAAQVTRALDRYAAAATAMRVEACTATVVRHAQSPALFDLRNRCLDRRVDQLAAQVAVLVAATPAAVDRAVPAVEALEPLSTCADADALTAVVPPGAPALTPAIAAVRGLVDRATALHQAGSYGPGRALADLAEVLARQLGYPPLVAEAAYVHARLAEGQGDYARARADLDVTLVAAGAGHDDRRTAAAWAFLVFVLGSDQAQLDQALALVPAARAALARVGPEPRLAAALDSNVGVLLATKGQVEQAVTLQRRALATVLASEGATAQAARACAELAATLVAAGRVEDADDVTARGLAIAHAVVGDRHLVTALLLAQRGAVRMAHGELDAAARDLEAALAVERDVLGPDAVHVGTELATLADIQGRQGRLALAGPNFDAALAIVTRAFGPDHPTIASTLMADGVMLDTNRRADQAVPLLERALAIYARVAGADSLPAARAHGALAQAYQDLDQLDAAEHHAQAAVDGIARSLGADARALVQPLYALAQVRESRGDAAGAVAELTRAIAVLDCDPTARPELAVLLTTLGEMQVDRGHPADAIAPLERAAALHAQAAVAPALAAATDLALGQALYDSGRDRPRGLALVRQADAGYAAPDFAPERAVIAAWLRARRLASR